jgi:hypothetical protein
MYICQSFHCVVSKLAFCFCRAVHLSPRVEREMGNRDRLHARTHGFGLGLKKGFVLVRRRCIT